MESTKQRAARDERKATKHGTRAVEMIEAAATMADLPELDGLFEARLRVALSAGKTARAYSRSAADLRNARPDWDGVDRWYHAPEFRGGR